MQHSIFLLFISVILCIQPISSSAESVCDPHVYTYCPTYCNEYGELVGSQCCEKPLLCCNMGNSSLHVKCCLDREKEIDSVATDGWNCVNVREKTPMAVVTKAFLMLGVLVGIVAILSTITVFTAQKVKRKRAQRRRSESAVSCTCDIIEPPTATSNPVDDIILHPVMVSPPPYSLITRVPDSSRTIPSEDPPTYDEVSTT